MSDTTKANPRGASGSNETNPKADKFSRILEAALEVVAIKGFTSGRPPAAPKPLQRKDLGRKEKTLVILPKKA